MNKGTRLPPFYRNPCESMSIEDSERSDLDCYALLSFERSHPRYQKSSRDNRSCIAVAYKCAGGIWHSWA